MSTEVDRDLHRSIEPAIRLIVAGVFALVGLVLAVFQIAGYPNAWVSPNPWLWTMSGASFLLAVIVYLMPVQSPPMPARQSLRPSETEPSAYDYKVSQAIEFYDRIADIYDARLTREYLDTIRCAADVLLQSFSDQTRQISVLDVGAGTGQFIRLLEGAKRVDWTCIEPSRGMAFVLRTFFDGPPVGARIHEVAWEDAERYLSSRRFDAIAMNSVLSSLEVMPDFSRLADLLERDGVLIISDGHPDIRDANRSFRIRALNGVHTLRIEHHIPSEVALAVTRSGQFRVIGTEKTITKGGRLYSYVLSFRKVDQTQGFPILSGRVGASDV